MLLRLNKYTYLIFAICFFVVAAIFENGLLKKHPEKHLIKDFQILLNKDEAELDKHLKTISELVVSDDYVNDLYNYLEENGLLLNDNGIGFLIYRNGELDYWSDRSISFYDRLSQISNTDGLLILPNGYYLAKSISTGKYDVVGLHLIKNNFQYSNKYLKNTFFHNYKLPGEFKIIERNIEGVYPVYNQKGRFLFSILPAGQYLCTRDQLYFPGFIYLLGLIILLYYFRKELLDSNSPFLLKLFALGVSLFIVYWIHLLFKIPKVFYELQLFSPDDFALNSWLPSLGDYFLLSVFFFFWMFNFTSDLDIDEIHKNSKVSRKWIIVVLLLFAGSIYLMVNFYIEELIINSTISFSLNKITEITTQSILGIFSVSLFLFSILYFTIKVYEQARNDFKFIRQAVVVFGVSIFLSLLQYFSIGEVSIPVFLFFIISSFLAILFSKSYLQKFTLSYLIIFVSITSVYSLFVIYNSTIEKERELQKSLAVTLVAERDPAAEVFLAEIQKLIMVDHVIGEMLIENDEGMELRLEEYLQQTYFNRYFQKYIFDSYVCSVDDSLNIEYEDRMAHCFSFFENMIISQGDQIPGTNFYFMNNMNGRISYTGKLNVSGILIFIELNSDLLFEGIGFPELLIDKSMMKPDNFKKFNYAKYYGGELTDKFGDYNYNFYVDSYLFSDEEFSSKQWDGMEHLIFRTREDNYVIVSRDLYTVVDYLISFPYLFVFYFLLVMVFLLLGSKTIRNRKVHFDLKFKIQAAIISIVFVSLLVVALITIFYNIERYKTKHSSDLDEKMKSISEEINMRLENVDEISVDLEESLDSELSKLSNIFRTDINVYDPGGKIIASSRIEIFDRGLVSSRINTQAFYEISENYQISYFQPEKIGLLSYLSAYQPIVNYRGNYLGFINLPYFIRQDNYSQEISTFIVAFINLYVLLFLVSIIVAVFISNQITRPLVVIQENLQKMQLGKRNEPIIYSRKDEIGSLVKEYNKKVDELSVSADLLARSERELAWREMAKQIAHEIKNPLTPMKLNIQHLQRARGEGEEFRKYIERISATLIEQIDNLSNIATEFSNFAKIPTARNQVFMLAEQLQKVIALFESNEQVKISFNSNGYEYIEVNADREQLSRAIINLIKNGIQSIPENKNGQIEILLSRRDHMAVIAVTDNGTGIPEELRDKLFSPSFTTKTSGMGLGLAIVKNIVENFAGKIWFDTDMEKGTTFFLEIPVFEHRSPIIKNTRRK